MPEQYDFTEKEISYIERKLGNIIFNWAKHLVTNVLSRASNEGVKVVYMNTSKTLASGANPDKTDYIYERLPGLLGFKKEKVNLRGRPEVLWAFHLGGMDVESCSFLRVLRVAENDRGDVAFDSVPSGLQGAFVGILGKKPFYTREEIAKVYGIIKDRRKQKSNFMINWDQKWDGGQLFKSDVVEDVVRLWLSPEMFEEVKNDPVLIKLYSYLCGKGGSGHFTIDTLGFALVSKVKDDVWVINQVQTDSINHYINIRNKYNPKKRTYETKMTWESLKDVLHGQNRDQWVPVLEGNEELKNKVLANPGIMHNLPDDNVNIQDWINQQSEDELMRHFAGVNFRTGIFRV